MRLNRIKLRQAGLESDRVRSEVGVSVEGMARRVDEGVFGKVLMGVATAGLGVLVPDDPPNRQHEGQDASQENQHAQLLLCHLNSWLSSVATRYAAKKIVSPMMKWASRKPTGETNGPNTRIANTTFARLYRAVAKPFRWLASNGLTPFSVSHVCWSCKRFGMRLSNRFHVVFMALPRVLSPVV